MAGAIEFEVRGDRRQLLFGGGEVDGLDGRGPLFGEGGKVPHLARFDGNTHGLSPDSRKRSSLRLRSLSGT
jgi:hypothetical protein